jgi:hypothetical protein
MIDIHTGWKITGEAIEVADKRMQGHGTAIGTSFNDRGSGPLHGGPATCFYTFFAAEGDVKNKVFAPLAMLTATESSLIGMAPTQPKAQKV